MRKIVNWSLVISFIIFLIDWGVLGLKLLNGDYDIMIEAHIGLICFIVVFGCIFIRSFTNRCPHCGRLRLTNGKYCSYCGKEILDEI